MRTNPRRSHVASTALMRRLISLAENSATSTEGLPISSHWCQWRFRQSKGQYLLDFYSAAAFFSPFPLPAFPPAAALRLGSHCGSINSAFHLSHIALICFTLSGS